MRKLILTIAVALAALSCQKEFTIVEPESNSYQGGDDAYIWFKREYYDYSVDVYKVNPNSGSDLVLPVQVVCKNSTIGKAINVRINIQHRYVSKNIATIDYSIENTSKIEEHALHIPTSYFALGEGDSDMYYEVRLELNDRVQSCYGASSVDVDASLVN